LVTDSGAGTVSASDPARWVGRYDFIGVARDGRTQTIVASELSYYPFTYVLAIGAPLPVDALAEINRLHAPPAR
jgi:hypothetical protein